MTKTMLWLLVVWSPGTGIVASIPMDDKAKCIEAAPFVAASLGRKLQWHCIGFGIEGQP
jgi:hypothetical protein